MGKGSGGGGRGGKRKQARDYILSNAKNLTGMTVGGTSRVASFARDLAGQAQAFGRDRGLVDVLFRAATSNSTGTTRRILSENAGRIANSGIFKGT